MPDRSPPLEQSFLHDGDGGCPGVESVLKGVFGFERIRLTGELLTNRHMGIQSETINQQALLG